MRCSLKKLLSGALLMTIAAGFYLTAKPLSAPFERDGRPQRSAQRASDEGEQKLVYMRSDRTFSIDVGDSMAVCMVGNFRALHNGAVITCDSAVRYDGQTIECFGNVLINQNTTFIYGDRADYQGRLNKAEVYSPLVKVIDGDATLYTFRFSFDTYRQVGEFTGGGVLFNRGNRLEADRGYYYSERHELSCVGRVEMCDSTYQMQSDSVIYNTDLDRAEFFRNTHIWNDQGEYLYGDRGAYDRPSACYSIRQNGYLLTEKDELWSDSLDYFREREIAYLRHAIQIDDAEYKTLAFGDYGEYWRNPGSALLTRNPSLVGYDTTQGDSIYMRADSILLLTYYTSQPEFNPWGPQREPADSLAADSLTLPGADSIARSSRPALPGQPPALGGEGGTPTPPFPGGMPGARPRPEADSTARSESPAGRLDSLGVESPADSLGGDEIDSLVDSRDSLQRLTDSLDTLSVKARKAFYKRIDRERKAAIKAEKAAARREKLAIIARARQAKITAQLNRMDSLEQLRLERRRARMEAKLQAKRERAIRRGKELPDSSALSDLDSLLSRREAAGRTDSLALDSLATDSLAVDSLAVDSLTVDSLAADTVRRVMYGYRKVKIYRTDFQAVCDSIVALGADSTLHLYIEPVLWNQQNQITSELMDIYTKGGEIDHADFVGRPIMVSQVDTACYNQISGKEMTAWFASNAIYRHDVNGNVETIYFLQDEPGAPANDMFVIRSGAASFYIENQQVVTMTYREQNEYSMFPLDMRPESQELYLKEYKWLPELRPSRDSVFTRTIRPSRRAETEALERPTFPLSDKILRYRDRLVETGRWADRDETLSPEVMEWVRRNGYEPSAPREGF